MARRETVPRPGVAAETVSQAFEASAADHADRPAQRYKGGVHDRSLAPGVIEPAPAGEFASLSYGELRGVVRRLAAGFRALGLDHGDRIGICAPTRMEWAHCDLAALAAGGVVTTIYPDSSAERARSLLDDAGATGLVVDDVETLDRLGVAAGDLDFVVAMDRPPGGRADREGVSPLAEVHDRGEAAYDAEAYAGWLDRRSPDALASLVYTSGTTGRPKGVRLTHRNLRANVGQFLDRMGGPAPGGVVHDRTRTLSFLPLAHVFERLVGHFVPLSAGASVAYASGPDTLLEDLALVSPTFLTTVPRVLERIQGAVQENAAGSRLRRRVVPWALEVARAIGAADDPGPALRLAHAAADRLVYAPVRERLGGGLEAIVSGGGSLSPELCARFHGMGVPVLEGYGLTETAPVVSVNPPDEPRVGTVGPPVSALEIRLEPVAGFEDVGGRVGELLVRGPNVTDGYWNRTAATDAAFDDGYFRTGDVVSIDGDGYLTFHERVKDLLVLSTGENVAPSPIEDAFSTVDVVEQCVVVGDGRRFVGALVVPNLAAVRAWADREGHPLPEDPRGICADERVHHRVGEAVEAVNAGLEPHETIKRFRLVPEPFTAEEGLLTPTLKKRRGEITDRYGDRVESIYD